MATMKSQPSFPGFSLFSLCLLTSLLLPVQTIEDDSLLGIDEDGGGLGVGATGIGKKGYVLSYKEKYRKVGIANAKKSVDLTLRNGGLDGIELDGRQACARYAAGDNKRQMDINKLLMCQYKHQMGRMLEIQNELERRDMGKLRPYSRDEYGTSVINPHYFKYKHQPLACSEEESIVVAVHSAAQNQHKRSVIRQTWANPHLMRQYLQSINKTKLVFILGSTMESSMQDLINFESELYRDILQATFIDNYYNNTYKALYHFKWVSGPQGCPKAKLILKADDDIMINLRKMPIFWSKFRSVVGTLTPERMLIAGNLYSLGPMRDRRQKWYIPYDQFPYDTFPPWFQGMVYFITPGLARRMFYFSYTTPYIFTDDVYVGILSDRVTNIERFNFFDFYEFAYESLEAKTLKWKLDPEVFYHNPEFSDMLSLWYINCDMNSC